MCDFLNDAPGSPGCKTSKERMICNTILQMWKGIVHGFHGFIYLEKSWKNLSVTGLHVNIFKPRTSGVNQENIGHNVR
jgi:hypothetical protein